MLDQFASQMREGFSELRAGFVELREGQAMMMQQFNGRDARTQEFRIESERRFLTLSMQILELRQDFLSHMRAYHPPTDQ
jgi:hypothetical protein